MTFHTPLPDSLFTAAQAREIDRLAIEEHGIDGFELMQRAARFSFHVLLKKWPATKSLLVLCGAGNNAGDGYIVAGLAKKRGLNVDLRYLSDPTKLSVDAAQAYQYCLSEHVKCLPFDIEQHPPSSDTIIVDALLGTGLNKEVTGSYREAIEYCNQSGLPILSIDIPSGLCADSGQPMGISVEAQATATFIGLKIGQFTGRGRHFCQELFYDDLEVPEEVISLVAPVTKKLSLTNLLTQLPKRSADTHKGDCGHVLLIGGDHGYGGAILMAAEAAARMGAGLITVATQPENCPALITRCPEVMARPVSSSADLKPLVEKASTIVVGPGLGQSAWSQHMLFTALHENDNSHKPTIVDADALNLLCTHQEWLPKSRDHFIFTPHPGEAARILKTTSSDIQNNRLKAIDDLNAHWGGTFLLKGSGSLILQENEPARLCPYGNPGMATGGMGDVLSGILGGLLAQPLSFSYAVNLAICLHAKAADKLALQYGERGLLASDIIKEARALLNGK